MAASARAPHPEERRAFLQAIGPAMDAISLPRVIPKLPTQAGRAPLAKYAAAVGTARRGTEPPTCFTVLMLKLQKAGNAVRRRLARASGVEANLLSEEAISYSYIINIINPIGQIIGFEDASAAAQHRQRGGAPRSLVRARGASSSWSTRTSSPQRRASGC